MDKFREVAVVICIIFLFSLVLSSDRVLFATAQGAVVATVTVGNSPYGVAYDSAKGEVFVANGASNTVSVISDGNNAVVKNIAIGGAPYGIAYDSSKGEVFVANGGSSNTVYVISDSGNALVATVTLPVAPTHLELPMTRLKARCSSPIVLSPPQVDLTLSRWSLTVTTQSSRTSQWEMDPTPSLTTRPKAKYCLQRLHKYRFGDLWQW